MEDEVDRIIAEWNRERPDLDMSPTHTLQRIMRASVFLATTFAGVFGRYGLTWGEGVVLGALRRSGPPYRMSPTALFNSILLSSGAMTNRLDRLEEVGLVRRLPDPNDRRGRLVALTTKGRELVDRVSVENLANQERLLTGLSTSDRTKLADLLRKLLLSEPFRALDPASRVRAVEKSRRSVRQARRSRASSR